MCHLPYSFHLVFTSYMHSILSLNSHIHTPYSSLFLNSLPKQLIFIKLLTQSYTKLFIYFSFTSSLHFTSFTFLFNNFDSVLLFTLISSSTFLICSPLPFCSLHYLIYSPNNSLSLTSQITIPNHFCCYCGHCTLEHTEYLTNCHPSFSASDTPSFHTPL